MEIIIIFILSLLNGFFALSEISIISAKKSRIEQKAIEGSNDVLEIIEEFKIMPPIKILTFS
ncbi:CNNM domain-containing protein [Adhaeribacter aquaticus]|uniref:CNNM domain-containing protein n=1 Tax=Adhaeribacter aquaticus TaxID=299567 RepID=UPI0004008C69|nr:CNNM domain-containing protein [Adhaeribacter aquaticus]